MIRRLTRRDCPIDMLPICTPPFELVLGQAERGLRVALNLVVAPARRVGAGFVQEARRKGVVPDDRESVVNLRVIEELITQSAVKLGRARWNPINREADMVLAGHIGIEASVVLFEIAGGRVGYAVLGDIRSVGESTADAGVCWRSPR